MQVARITIWTWNYIKQSLVWKRLIVSFPYIVSRCITKFSQQSSREMCGSRYGELIFQAWVRLKGAERSKYIGCALRLIHLYVLRSRLSQTECEFSFSIFANGVWQGFKFYLQSCFLHVCFFLVKNKKIHSTIDIHVRWNYSYDKCRFKLIVCTKKPERTPAICFIWT